MLHKCLNLKNIENRKVIATNYQQEHDLSGRLETSLHLIRDR